MSVIILFMAGIAAIAGWWLSQQGLAAKPWLEEGVTADLREHSTSSLPAAKIGGKPFLQPGLGCQPLLGVPPARNCGYSGHEQDDGAHGWDPCADNPAGGSFCGTKSLAAPGTL